MVYLEAPVGVGFSYSDDSSDYNTDDDQTAADNLAAVQGTLLLPITISIMQSTA
jgi:carboxypeptidase C (cathepsin A)